MAASKAACMMRTTVYASSSPSSVPWSRCSCAPLSAKIKPLPGCKKDAKRTVLYNRNSSLIPQGSISSCSKIERKQYIVVYNFTSGVRHGRAGSGPLGSSGPALLAFCPVSYTSRPHRPGAANGSYLLTQTPIHSRNGNTDGGLAFCVGWVLDRMATPVRQQTLDAGPRGGANLEAMSAL